MSDELLLPVECPSTRLYARSTRAERTAPRFNLIMSSVLMPLPVILGAERFGAGCVSAPIWTGMALRMFSEKGWLSACDNNPR